MSYSEIPHLEFSTDSVCLFGDTTPTKSSPSSSSGGSREDGVTRIMGGRTAIKCLTSEINKIQLSAGGDKQKGNFKSSRERLSYHRKPIAQFPRIDLIRGMSPASHETAS